MAQLIPMLLKEMEQEANTTRKMLALVPDDKHDWKPHEKSMTMSRLASHIAELPGWVSMTLNTAELDFAKNAYTPVPVKDNADLLGFFERTLAAAKDELEKSTEEQLDDMWTLRNGDQVFVSTSKAGMIRSTYCQVVHHRAQLGVYLRLLNVPIPGSYGPSADDMGM